MIFSGYRMRFNTILRKIRTNYVAYNAKHFFVKRWVIYRALFFKVREISGELKVEFRA